MSLSPNDRFSLTPDCARQTPDFFCLHPKKGALF
jgi:hypothetical protein